MRMTELIQRLEIAILRRNPSLAANLQPGLSVLKIKAALKRKRIEGAVEPILDLYSWRNGTDLQTNLNAVKAGFAPPVEYELSEIEKRALLRQGIKRDTAFRDYNFLKLETAILDMGGFRSYAQYHPRLSVLVGRYFPFLWDGSNGYIALDIEPSANSRVVMIQTQDAQPLREAHNSFEEFLKDAIRANENDEPLACIRTPGRPITEAPQHRLEPSHRTIATKAVAGEKRINVTENALALRTDFSDDHAWKLLCTLIQNPADEFAPGLDLISDPEYEGLTVDQLHSLLPDQPPISFAFIIDRTALTQPDHPILVIDLHERPGRTFRVVPSVLGDVANNLSIANMDFDEFANAVDQDGVFRGFPQT